MCVCVCARVHSLLSFISIPGDVSFFPGDLQTLACFKIPLFSAESKPEDCLLCVVMAGPLEGAFCVKPSFEMSAADTFEVDT